MIAIKYLHMPSERAARFLVKSGLLRLLPMRGLPSLVVRTVGDVEFYDKANGKTRRYGAGEYFVSFEECVRSRLFGLLWDPNDAMEALRANHPGEWSVFERCFEYVGGYYLGDTEYLARCAEMDARHRAEWLTAKKEKARWEPDRIDETVAEATEEELERHVRNYMIWSSERSGGAFDLVTAYCQLGGCTMESIEFGTLREALAEAARREALGVMPEKSVCAECASEYWDA